MIIASTPLHPFLMLTAKRGLRMTVPCIWVPCPIADSTAPEARAIAPVKGSMTWSLTGFQAIRVKPPPSSATNTTRKRSSWR